MMAAIDSKFADPLVSLLPNVMEKMPKFLNLYVAV